MHPASTSSGAADSASAAAHAELAVLETAAAAAAAAVEQARQRAAAAAARAAAAAAAAIAAATRAAVPPADLEGTADSDDAGGETEEYEVEAIVSTTRACDDKSAGGGKAHTKQDCKCERTYLVKWKGYDADGDNTWESEERLMHNAKDVLTAFKVAHKVPPYHQPSRSSSRSSSNASQTAAAAAVATANATAVKPAPAQPTALPHAVHTNGTFRVYDVPGEGACGAHALAIADGARATSHTSARAVYTRTAEQYEAAPKLFTDAVADEDDLRGDPQTAVAKRITALRDTTRNHNMTLTDVDAYSRQCAYKIVVVSCNANGITVTHCGRGTAFHTAVLLFVAAGRSGHYRIVVPADTTSGTTFDAVTGANAVDFGRAHVTAWAQTGAAAPMYPADTCAAAATAPPKPKPGATVVATTPPAAGAGAGATASDSKRDEPQWHVQSRGLRYAEKLTAERTVVVTTQPHVSDINTIEQRLQSCGITLSQFAKRWTVAPGGALHVEAPTPAMHAALLDRAATVRHATHKTGLIDITPLRPALQPDAKTPGPAHAKAKATPAKPPKQWTKRGKPSGRGRGDGERGGVRGITASDSANSAAHTAPDATNAVLMAVLELTRQIAHRDQRTRSRTRSPPPRAAAPPYCAYCAKRAHTGACGQRATGHADSDAEDPAPPARARSRSRTSGHESDSDGRGDRSGSSSDRTKWPTQK